MLTKLNETKSTAPNRVDVCIITARGFTYHCSEVKMKAFNGAVDDVRGHRTLSPSPKRGVLWPVRTICPMTSLSSPSRSSIHFFSPLLLTSYTPPTNSRIHCTSSPTQVTTTNSTYTADYHHVPKDRESCPHPGRQNARSRCPTAYRLSSPHSSARSGAYDRAPAIPRERYVHP